MEIDRLAPTFRPNAYSIMRQRWAELLFLYWEVDAAQLQSLLPLGLELDTYEGRAYVGLVPFTMTGIRPTVLPPFPPLSNFHEINVRTYVHHQGAIRASGFSVSMPPMPLLCILPALGTNCPTILPA